MNAVQLPDELVQGIVLKSGGSWGDAAPEDREFFKHFANLVAAHEREECAKVCEDSVEYAADELARQIRAKGKA
jgi:hypothetical protein